MIYPMIPTVLSFLTSRWFRKAVLPAIVICMAGVSSSCSFGPSPLSPAALQQRGLKPGEGLIVGSFKTLDIDRSGKTVQSMVLTRTVSGKGTGPETAKHFTITPVSSGEEVFAIPVPAGNYEITDWMIMAMGFNATITVRNRLPMKVPFKVNAGEAVYVGRMNAISLHGKNLFGMTVFGEGLILATDEFAKDEVRIAKTYPIIRRSSIRRSQVPNGYKAEMKRIAATPSSWWQSLVGF